MPTRNINLTPQLDRFVEEQIAEGQYSNASEVLRAGLRLLEQRRSEDREKLALLRKLAQEGLSQLDRGEGLVIESKRQLASEIAKIGRRAAKKNMPRQSSR
jgi:antitoxin ParD1/3/4